MIQHFYLYKLLFLFPVLLSAVYSLHVRVQEITTGRTEDKIRHCAVRSGSTPFSPSSVLPPLCCPSYLQPLSWPPPCCMLLVREENSMGLEQAQVNTVKKHSPVHSSQSETQFTKLSFCIFPKKKKKHTTQAGAFLLKLLDCAILKITSCQSGMSRKPCANKREKREKNHIIVTAFKLQKGIQSIRFYRWHSPGRQTMNNCLTWKKCC